MYHNWKPGLAAVGWLTAMVLGAAGAIVPFFFLHSNETTAGFAAFGLAAVGLVVGSALGRPHKPPLPSGTQGTTI